MFLLWATSNGSVQRVEELSSIVSALEFERDSLRKHISSITASAQEEEGKLRRSIEQLQADHASLVDELSEAKHRYTQVLKF